MSRGIILELIPKEGFDFSEIIVDYANGRPVNLSKCELLHHTSVIHDFKEDFIDYISKYGFSSFVKQELILEAVVVPGEPINHVVTLLNNYLRKIDLTTDLIIVDPYFFASTKDTNYKTLVASILSPAATLKSLTIITLPGKVDTVLKNDVISCLQSEIKDIHVIHKTSTDFHY